MRRDEREGRERKNERKKVRTKESGGIVNFKRENYAGFTVGARFNGQRNKPPVSINVVSRARRNELNHL